MTWINHSIVGSSCESRLDVLCRWFTGQTRVPFGLQKPNRKARARCIRQQTMGKLDDAVVARLSNILLCQTNAECFKSLQLRMGNLTWQMDERGFLTRTSFDIATKAIIQVVNDVDTTQVNDAPPGWTTPAGGGLHLITDYEFDDEGRTTQTLGPGHVIDVDGSATTIRRATWTVYHDDTHQVWSGHGYAT